jgi:hypothetical protein
VAVAVRAGCGAPATVAAFDESAAGTPEDEAGCGRAEVSRAASPDARGSVASVVSPTPPNRTGIGYTSSLGGTSTHRSASGQSATGRPRSATVGHSRPPSPLVGHGRPQSATVAISRPPSAISRHCVSNNRLGCRKPTAEDAKPGL